MINPIIFSFHIGSFEFALRWYGVLVMTGVVIAGWFAGVKLRGAAKTANRFGMRWSGSCPRYYWRTFVVCSQCTLGGNPYYVQNPIQIINIPRVVCIFMAGCCLGPWPCSSICVTIKWISGSFWMPLRRPHCWVRRLRARPILLTRNFMANRPLYRGGFRLTRPTGSVSTRIWPSTPLTTRFHPAFAYEMIWNFSGLCLDHLSVPALCKSDETGTPFFGWLVLAGVGRFLIEFFRPDQPRVAAHGSAPLRWWHFDGPGRFAHAGLPLWKLKLPLPALPEKYQISPRPFSEQKTIKRGCLRSRFR